jgi:beta-lactam-binding protein with PASTA domain
VIPRGGHTAAALALGLGLPTVLAACSSSPSPGQRSAARSVLTTTSTTTTTTVAPTTTTTKPGVIVPNVIGETILAARNLLHAAGLRSVGLNVACNKGTLASQSVVSSLAISGKPPELAVGAVPVSPGATVPAGTGIGIVWSGCYGNGSVVPAVIGMKFEEARHAITLAGLTWACYSVGRPTTTSSSTAPSSTVPASATTTTRPPNVVLSQNPTAGMLLKAGTTVALTMHTCPQ